MFLNGDEPDKDSEKKNTVRIVVQGFQSSGRTSLCIQQLFRGIHGLFSAKEPDLSSKELSHDRNGKSVVFPYNPDSFLRINKIKENSKNHSSEPGDAKNGGTESSDNSATKARDDSSSSSSSSSSVPPAEEVSSSNTANMPSPSQGEAGEMKAESNSENSNSNSNSTTSINVANSNGSAPISTPDSPSSPSLSSFQLNRDVWQTLISKFNKKPEAGFGDILGACIFEATSAKSIANFLFTVGIELKKSALALVRLSLIPFSLRADDDNEIYFPVVAVAAAAVFFFFFLPIFSFWLENLTDSEWKYCENLLRSWQTRAVGTESSSTTPSGIFCASSIFLPRGSRS